ncbi:hypothetical protein Hanom_Chr08g00744421 [Helianthus anomalus]
MIGGNKSIIFKSLIKATVSLLLENSILCCNDKLRYLSLSFKSLICAFLPSTCFYFSEKLQKQFSRVPSCNGTRSFQADDVVPGRFAMHYLQIVIKARVVVSINYTNETAGGDEHPVIQQKGRFKVTSECHDAAIPPVLQKSHSMQVGVPIPDTNEANTK